MINGELDIIIITYFPKYKEFAELLRSINASSRSCFRRFKLIICDNSCNNNVHKKISDLVAHNIASDIAYEVLKSESNVGFGRGVNSAAKRGGSAWLLLINQDAVLEDDCIEVLGQEVERIRLSRGTKIAAIECRQIPYEHPKIYNPVTLGVNWISGAACLIRRDAFELVRGFDPNIFMYAEDVDLSWRLRANGYELRYCPKAAVVHNTYEYGGQEKAVQAIEGTLTNLLLRARYGSYRDIIAGMRGLARQILLPETFPGKRRAFATLPFRAAPYLFRFRTSGRKYRSAGFRAEFCGWDYALHRDGAFFPFRSKREWSTFPLVSIIVRTYRRPFFLSEALMSIVNQTYPNIEIIVVEDGPSESGKIVEKSINGERPYVYVAVGKNLGRSHAGNLGLSKASGDWIGFLDDDDQFFSDHVEVLVQSVLGTKFKGAYAGTWEVATDITTTEPLQYEEIYHRAGFRYPFSKYLLWKRNYMPIQSVLFHRELYEEYGGFDTDMTFLEDWNLWTRYTLKHDFLYVDKLTSKYRVPADKSVYAARQAELDKAYREALERQSRLEVAMTPVEFVQACREFNSYNAIIDEMENPSSGGRFRDWSPRLRSLVSIVKRRAVRGY